MKLLSFFAVNKLLAMGDIPFQETFPGTGWEKALPGPSPAPDAYFFDFSNAKKLNGLEV
jgi:hypothetical protein